jgi:hypothetical protein
MLEEKYLIHSSDVNWWLTFKDKLLAEIQRRAASGDFQLSIDKDHKLNEFNFIGFQRLRDHVNKELEQLGYEVNYSQGSQQFDGDDRSLTVKW